MRRRNVFAVGALSLASLVVVSLAAASSPFKQYTFAAAPKTVSPAGTMTVLLPAEWQVSRQAAAARESARDSLHRSVLWFAEAVPEPKGTTLAEVRSYMLRWSGTTEWGPGARMRRTAGDMYLTLPMGKVWRYTLALVPTKTTGPKLKAEYNRIYVLDRSPVRASGAEKELFIRFSVFCSPLECQTHNGQLATIMGSIRFQP